MGSPFVDWRFWYEQLPYKYDLEEPFQWVKVPLTGPAPFNTLGYVKGQASTIVGLDVANGHTHHDHYEFSTPLIADSYDPTRFAGPYPHSTTGHLRLQEIQGEVGAPLGLSDSNIEFRSSVELITGAGFTDAGRWSLSFDVASAALNSLYAAQFEFSSFVAFYEPR